VDRGLITCQYHAGASETCTHGTFVALECSVVVSSLGHGGQVSVSLCPHFDSVDLHLEPVMSLCI
jgi:hypothetical protein